MRSSIAVALLTVTASLSASAYDQPEVKFFVELASDGRIVECPTMVGSLGDSMEVVLSNRLRVVARAAPQNDEGRSAINLRIYSPSGQLAQEFNYSAKLAQQKPSFQYTSKEPRGRLTVMVESASLLATSRNKPSWREFDTRMKPNNAIRDFPSIVGGGVFA